MTQPKPVVALLGAAAGARQALALDLIERLAQAGVGAELGPEFIFELPAGRPSALTLLIASDAGPDDARVRGQLAHEGISYSVLHGDAPARLTHAWQMIRPLLNLPAEQAPSRGTWNWACDKCSDPACEHRLFQDLLARRPAASGTDPAR